nr:hypothetical protein [uncultured Lacinutrix sp.]
MNPIIYPNQTEGDSSKIEEYIFDTCQKHKNEKRALAFAFIISDLDDPQITKILRDEDYVNALHKISGHYLTIFYLNDNYVDKRISKAINSNQIRLELGVQKIDAPSTLTPKFIAKNLINRENLPSPSILFFQVNERIITDYTFAQLSENDIENGFNEMKQIVKTAIESLSQVTEENRDNHNELFSLVKSSIDSSTFWKNAKKSYAKLIKLKDLVSFFG